MSDSVVVDWKGKLIKVGSVVADLSSRKEFVVESIAGGLLTGNGTNGTSPEMSFVNYLPRCVEVVTQQSAKATATRRV